MKQRKNIVFIGMPGAGKTTTAKKLSTRLNIPWIDLDDQIMEENKMTLKEIISTKGQKMFNEIEKNTCLKYIVSKNLDKNLFFILIC